jgi:hypothetical protein|tara:strand:+ start:825 stop:1703 length:879 start_codon:yes stop_codon:yes gene_type:complete
MENKIEYIPNRLINHNREYENWISIDDLYMFLKSPRNYFFKKSANDLTVSNNLPKPKDSTFSLGLCIYEKIVNPLDSFKKKYIVSPKFDKRTKLGKEKYANFMDIESIDKIIISQDDNNLIDEIITNILINEKLYNKIIDSNFDCSVYLIDKISGLKIKLKTDIFIKDKLIIDFKSSKDSSINSFKSEIDYNNYSLTSAIYMDFLKIKEYVFISCENKAPYQMSIYSLNKKLIEQGRKDYRIALDLLKWSYDNNYWCDYIDFEILKENYFKNNLKNVMSIFSSQDKSKSYII